MNNSYKLNVFFDNQDIALEDKVIELLNSIIKNMVSGSNE